MGLVIPFVFPFSDDICLDSALARIPKKTRLLVFKILELIRNLCSMQGNSVLYATSGILRGSGSSWRIYYTLIDNEPAILIARDTIAKMFGVSAMAVQKFIINYNFPTFEVTLQPANKRKLRTLTLLSTAVSYWKYLSKRRKLSHLPTRTDARWQKFMADCENLKYAEVLPEPEAVQDSDYLCTPDYDFEENISEEGVLFDCFFESIGMLSVVVDRQGKYWITPQSGLSVIDASTEWLDKEMKRSAKKNRVLRQRGFSGKYSQHLYKAERGNFCRVTTLSFEDWLTIWAYFALQKNQKALALLKLLAQKSLAELLKDKRLN
ncbi:hypothetical protein H6S82_00035 [Planktothrix sp. FACHB-1355]|uniref:Uncharacterized protein n=1 Tax=Aerosakkonema funiforme FACHB-1375 TaxID=2949571 RepID=A0A926VDK5_9CYAN|nr:MULTISPECIES: hypothetical protein [Oscillatoriales]MBD2181841.1 hypothetical protein [Aerosakkonema funiforme FACHB-1375]MBD3557261.1 hypothetical protein [Planktothrix sp. FACHB-1355]